MTDDRHPATEIDWQRLLAEFDRYRPEPDLAGYDPMVFARALADPLPEFAQAFLRQRLRAGGGRPEAVRDLFGYLMQKRQQERLNLLHFAFDVFDGPGRLPDDVLAQTPLPHEDGRPSYRHRLDPAFNLAIPPAPTSATCRENGSG